MVFEQAVVGAALDAYHYPYPPVLLLPTPLALMGPTCRRCSRGWRRVGTLAIAHCVWRCRAKARCCSRWPRRAVFINAVGGQNSTWTAATRNQRRIEQKSRCRWIGLSIGLKAK